MSRFDYDDDGEQHITYEMWQWNLKRALASRKGQTRLREFRDALLAMPEHRLIRNKIADADGNVCAVGAFAAWKQTQQGKAWSEATADLNQRYHPVTQWGWADETDGFETQYLGMKECGLNSTLAWYLGYENDEGYPKARTPEELWQATYAWVCEQLGEPLV